MRVGVDSYCFHRQLGELRAGERAPARLLPDGGPAVIAALHGLPLDAVALQTSFLDPPGAFDPDGVRVAAQAAGFELALSWGSPLGLELGANRRALDDLLAWIELAPALECNLIRIVVGGPSLRALAENWSGAVAPLGRAAARAGGLDVRLALENHGDLRASQLAALVTAVGDERLGVCFDSANTLRVGDDPLEAARLLAPSVLMVHLKDIEPPETASDPVAGPRSVPLGRGVVDPGSVLRMLCEYGFDGLVCVEFGQLAADADEQALVAQDVAWLRAWQKAETSAG